MRVRIGDLLLVVLTVTRLADARARTLDSWPADSARIAMLMRSAEHHRSIWDLDSTIHYAERLLPEAQGLMGRLDRRVDTILLLWQAKAHSLLAVCGADNEEEHLNEALQIQEDLGLQRARADLHAWRGEMLSRKGDYAGALQELTHALRGYRELGLQQEVVNTLDGSSYLNRMLGDLSAALECQLEALRWIEQQRDTVGLARAHIMIGAVYREKDDAAAALANFHEARRLYTAARSEPGLSTAYNDLGSIHIGNGDLDSAEYWHERALALREKIQDTNGQATSLMYLGSIARKQGMHQLAMDRYGKAADLYRIVPNPDGEASAYESIAKGHMFLGETLLAKASFERALRVRERSGVGLREQAFLWFALARVHASMGGIGAQRSALHEGVRIGERSNDLQVLLQGYRLLFEFFASTDDPRSAYAAHKEYLRIKDETRRKRSGARLATLMSEYGRAQQAWTDSVRIHAASMERRHVLEGERWQRQLYLAGGFLLLAFAAVLYARVRASLGERRQAEELGRSLRLAKAKAEAGERFKERFLANMSHEVRTPMNAIMGMTAILRRERHLPEQDAPLRAIATNAEGLLDLLNDILDMSKLDAGRLELESLPMDPRAEIQEVLERQMAPANAKGLVMETDLADDLPAVILGDPHRFKQVIRALVDNAIKFTEKGTIRITAMRSGSNEPVLRIEVHDTGMGIPADRIDKVFEEFTKAYSDERHKHGGTGLGLALSKRLMELQGGSLSVVSEEGKGSTFTIQLPMTETDERPSREKGVSSKRLEGIRILLAEDNAFNIMVASDVLENAIPGVSVDVAHNGLEALAMVKMNSYDLVLMDVQMPEMNGLDATSAIRRLPGPSAAVPILAMSANVDRVDQEAFMSAGMNGSIPKPFEQEELIEAIAQSVRYRV